MPKAKSEYDVKMLTLTDMQIKAFYAQRAFAKELNVALSTVNNLEQDKTKTNVTAMNGIKAFCDAKGMDYETIGTEWLKMEKMDNLNAQLKKTTIKQYVIGIAIALGFYNISGIVGSFFNVLVSYTAGYKSFSAFLESENIAGTMVIFIVGLANHIFTSWITTKVMKKYGDKNNCITPWFFRSAAVAVVAFALIIVPLLYSKNAGWITWLSHSLGIALFGRKIIKRNKTSERELFPAESIHGVDKSCANESNTVAACTEKFKSNDFCFCHKCGAKVSKNSKFCHKCGTSLI